MFEALMEIMKPDWIFPKIQIAVFKLQKLYRDYGVSRAGCGS